MELEPGLRIIHEPNRLRIMTLLYQRRDIGAASAREALGLTPGNLDSHARRLADAGFLESRRVLLRSGFEARYRITQRGSRAMEEYLEWLESMLSGLRGGA